MKCPISLTKPEMRQFFMVLFFCLKYNTPTSIELLIIEEATLPLELLTYLCVCPIK
jgi:hypothetical protein